MTLVRLYDAGTVGYHDYGYQYDTDTDSDAADDYNTWQVETTETPPDGSTYTVYNNFAGQAMLTDLLDGSDDAVTYNRYDDNGLLLWTAQPSAFVTSTPSTPRAIPILSIIRPLGAARPIAALHDTSRAAPA